ARGPRRGQLERLPRVATFITPVQQAYPRRMGIEVRPATGRWDDFASFMVPRKPGGRGCVCIAYRNSSLDMPFQEWHGRGDGTVVVGEEMRSGGGAFTGGPTAQARIHQGRWQVRLVERADVGAGRDDLVDLVEDVVGERDVG